MSNLSAPEPLQARGGGFEIRCVREALHRLALELLSIETEHGAEGPIAMAIAALAIGKSDADGRTLDRIAEQGLDKPGVRLLQESFDFPPGNASIRGAHCLRPTKIQRALHSHPTRSSH